MALECVPGLPVEEQVRHLESLHGAMAAEMDRLALDLAPRLTTEQACRFYNVRPLTYGVAKELHNGDEVRIIATGKVVKVVSVSIDSSRRRVVVEAETEDGFRELAHTELS